MAVSMGLTPLVVPVLVASAKSVVQAAEAVVAVLAESTQAARMLPRVSSSACGATAPLPATVVWLAMKPSPAALLPESSSGRPGCCRGWRH